MLLDYDHETSVGAWLGWFREIGRLCSDLCDPQVRRARRVAWPRGAPPNHPQMMISPMEKLTGLL